MRVSLLSHNARAGDAVGNHVAEKLAFFLESGADVRVFVESDHDLHPGIRSHCRLLAAEPRGDGWRFLAASDLVIVDYAQAYALLGLLPLLAGSRRRIVFDYHGVTPPELWQGMSAEALVHGARMRGAVWCADAAFVHSRFARAELLQPTGFPAERTFAMGYALNRDLWTGASRRDFRVRLGLGKARLMLFVGRLAPNKRVPLLVEALAGLRDMEPPLHAVVVGDDTDIYQVEAERCRARARELGVAERLHVVGRLPGEQLREAYHSADVFVMPSLHEGFCLPVVEAMACGLPVVAARAAALPETIGDAGLTFEPEDVAGLVRQVRRVLDPEPRGARPAARTGSPRNICIVTARYGDGFAGGAERSLRTIAEALHAAGHQVAVFTTCARSDGVWRNELRAGSERVGPITVTRFRVDPLEEPRVLRSTALLQALAGAAFDTIIAGPYLSGLTLEVARTFPDRAVILPCFHDEPEARNPVWRDAYQQAAAMLYHSAEEQAFAEAELGINHPGAHVVGTLIDAGTAGAPQRGQAAVGTGRRQVVYCGRYSAEKGVPQLIDMARDYARAHPDRFTFVFLGEGAVAIPDEPWARDLGFVSDAVKRDVLAGAAALVHWSERESLSLAALEAWAQGAPLLCNARCAVLRGQLERCGGGAAADDPAAFARLLDDLWQHPQEWQARGERGRRHVREHYANPAAFAATLEQALTDMRAPLGERLRARGQRRAEQCTRDAWRHRFAAALEQVLDLPARPRREQLEVVPRAPTQTVAMKTRSVLVPVQVSNRGTHPALADGPARWVLRSYLADTAMESCRPAGPDTPLPGLLMPGQVHAAALPLAVPSAPGVYRVAFHAEPAQGERLASADARHTLTLTVTEQAGAAEGCCAPLLEHVRAALAEAHALQRLPNDYVDVSGGRLAALKRWLKRKLLGNFKRAYVDVLSRQQSDFNRRLLHALQELSECCATLDHACSQRVAPMGDAAGGADRFSDPEVLRHMLRTLTEQLAEARERSESLHDRVARLEALLQRRAS